MDKLPLIVGHRGASQDAPENTLESFQLAWEQGADGIEADFRLTSDNQIICMHDETTARTSGMDLKIADTTLDRLRSLDVGAWKGVEWAGARIPTLPEVLAAVPEGTWFFIEIKCGTEIIAPLEKALRASGISPERIRLLSFNAALIAELKKRMPGWGACWLCDFRHSRRQNIWSPAHKELLETLRLSAADGLAGANRKFLDVQLTKQVKELDLEIHVWTVDRLTDARRLGDLGVDSIMTNRPGWLRRKLSE